MFLKIHKTFKEIERTQNSRLNFMTSSCDFDLESALLSHEFCTPSH